MWIDVDALMTDTVTVADRLETGSGDEWRCTTLRAWWHDTGSASQSVQVSQPGRSVKVQVAEEDADGYVEPSSYEGEGWTLRPGDRVIHGEVSYEGGIRGLDEALEGMDWATVTEARDLRLGDAGKGLAGAGKWMSILYCEAS